MRKINVATLKPGAVLAKNVYNDNGEILLKKGLTITPGFITKLRKLAVPFVYIDSGDIPNRAPGDVISQDTRVAAARQIEDVLLKTKEAGKLVIEPQAIYSTVSEFTEQLFSSSSLVYSLHGLRSQDDYTFAHSVNVCVLSLMTGITLGYSEEQLMALGVGAIMHDIGKVKVPLEILNKPGKLTEEEFNIIKKHSIDGYELIVKGGQLGDDSAKIAYQHHECYDGSGYPLGISGDEFHEYAQIVSIADKFDALTSHRVYRPPFPAHEAYEMCAGAGNLWFQERVVKAFLHNIAAYPEGTKVQLSSGMIAEVMDTPKGCSLFPRVRVVLNKSGRPVKDQYEIALYEVKDIKVVKVLKEEEYEQLLKNSKLEK